MHVAMALRAEANTLVGAKQLVYEAFAEALELIPSTLAENAGLDATEIVTHLRSEHAKGNKYAGINVRKVLVV